MALQAFLASSSFLRASKKQVNTAAILNVQIHEHQEKYGLRIIGPNSFGIIRPRTNLFATFADKRADPGKIAFISQSAALCAVSFGLGLGRSESASARSSPQVQCLTWTSATFIDYFGVDPQTKSIMLYVESLKNPRKFMSAAREFARDKPIVVVKAGRFRESREATLSHSGALGRRRRNLRCCIQTRWHCSG